MSLNPLQIHKTKKEFSQNFDLTGLSKEQVAQDLNISISTLENLLELKIQSINDPWILRNYLLEKVEKAGNEPVRFTALAGDWHNYWFLNADIIDRGLISESLD